MGKKKGLATVEGTEAIGERLTRLRKARGLTQIDLAARLGTRQAIVSKYERGGLRLHGELISRLAEILDVSADELLGIERKQHRPLPPPLKDRRLLRRLQALDQLSKRDREAVVRTLDAFIARGQPA